MSMRCEDVRPLLAELVYDEVDPGVADAVREHLGECLSCRRHQMAFTAVRSDLQEWQPSEESVPHGMTFIAPGAHVTTPIWHSRVFQGLAAAASFMFLAVLTAAATNLQVQSGSNGWAVSASFGQSTNFDAEPPEVGIQQIRNLDSYFDERLESQLGNQLDNRGVVTLASMPQQQFLTDGQVEEMNRRFSGMLSTSFAERDLQLENELENVRYYVDIGLEEQSNQFFYGLTAMVDDMESQHRDQLFAISQEFGAMHADTDRKVDQANFRIDNLLAASTRAPEQEH